MCFHAIFFNEFNQSNIMTYSLFDIFTGLQLSCILQSCQLYFSSFISVLLPILLLCNCCRYVAFKLKMHPQFGSNRYVSIYTDEAMKCKFISRRRLWSFGKWQEQDDTNIKMQGG